MESKELIKEIEIYDTEYKYVKYYPVLNMVHVNPSIVDECGLKYKEYKNTDIKVIDGNMKNIFEVLYIKVKEKCQKK